MTGIDYTLLHWTNQTLGLPDFVKQAATTDLASDELEPDAYADRRNRRFPCHTAAATWFSGVSFAEKQAEYLDTNTHDLVQQRILAAAAYFGIRPQVEAAMQKVAEVQRADATPELQDSDYALVIRYDDGSVSRHYPMTNAASVKAAANYFDQHRFEFKFADRRTIAAKILEKAAQFGADIRQYATALEKTAGYGTCPTQEVVAMLETRARMIAQENTELSTELRKLAARCREKQGELAADIATRTNIAETIDMFDRRYGLIRSYGSTIQPPEDVLFGVTTQQLKTAASEFISTVTGNTYRLSDLETVPIAQVRDVLGDEFASEISVAGVKPDIEKMAEIVPTLPRNDAELFEALLHEVGVKPIPVKQASTRKGFVDMSEVAKQHEPAQATGLWAYIHK